MIDSNTRDMLSSLRIPELADIIDRQEGIPEFLAMPFEDRLGHAVFDLYSVKNTEHNMKLVRNAKFKHPNASFSAIDYIPERHLDRSLLCQLSACNFLGHGTNIAFFGATGCGKSYLASCLGINACLRGYPTRFYRMPDLLADYDCLESPVKKRKFIKKLANYDLLILDEWITDIRYSEAQLSLIFEIVEKRNEMKPSVFCSQYNPGDWYAALGENSKSESILNRIFSSLCKVDCGDFNMREYYKDRNTVF